MQRIAHLLTRPAAATKGGRGKGEGGTQSSDRLVLGFFRLPPSPFRLPNQKTSAHGAKKLQRKALTAVFVTAVVFMAVSCQQRTQPTTSPQTTTASTATPETGELMILCGTSFGPPVEKLSKMFQQQTGQKAVISFGGSEDLLPQVKLRTVGDVFVTHDPYMDETEKANAMLRWIHVGYVAPVLVVQKGNPKNLKGFDDLAGDGLQVVLPNPDFSTCGEMVFARLAKKDEKSPGFKDKVLKNVGNAQFRSHSQIGNQMKLGNGDAAIMWNGVANNFLDALQIIPGPYEYDEEIRVGVIGLSYSDQDKVEQFLKFVDQHGEAVFEEFGYVK